MAGRDSSVSNTIGEVDVEVHQKYDIKRRIGKGAYGIVWQAVNKETGQVVAVKKIFDAFRNRTDAQRTYREVMFLRRFGHHPNVTTLLEVMRAKNDLDLYLVLEHMDSDLHQVIRRGNLLKDIHVRYIMYQLLQALHYLHSANVIHRDQKPSNILLDSDCRIRVADFGLARSLFTQLDEDDPSDPTLTEYVATRWYRAPEILLADKSYTTGVDMWSVGCILGEMILGKPLFPGTSTLNQIERIMSAIRPPSWAEIVSMCSGYALSILERANNRPKKPLSEMMPNASNDALDLMTKLLQFCPEKRISAEQALQHPYFNRFRPQSESLESLEQKFCPLREDTRRLSVGEYRQKLYQFIETEVDEWNETNGVNDDNDNNDEEDLQATSVSDSEESPVSVKRKDDNEDDSPEAVEKEEKAECIQNTNGSTAKTTRRTLHKSFSQESSPVASKHNKPSDTTAQPLQSKSTTPDCLGRCPAAVAAGLPSHHPRANTASAWLRFHDHHLVPVANYKTIVHQTPSHKRSMTSDVVKQNYGRKQFGNFSNASSLGSPKIVMHSYTQSHGTIAASALKQLRLSK